MQSNHELRDEYGDTVCSKCLRIWVRGTGPRPGEKCNEGNRATPDREEDGSDQ